MEFTRFFLVLSFFYISPHLSKGQNQSYENSIILTTVPSEVWRPDTHHIYLIPGTPYDLARNLSYYSPHFHFKKSGQLNAKLHGCKVDYERKVMYMYDESAARIEAIPNFDWSNHFASVTSVVRLHVGVSVGYVKIAIDWVSHNIYWTDPMFRWIAMQPGDPDNIDTSLYKIIVKEDLEKPYGLAVDPFGGFIFWTEISKYPKIERATLTGNNREAIISSGLLFPICIDVDVTGSNRRIYWADTSRDTVESANLTGGERRIIKRMSHTEFYDIALFRDVLSVVDVNGNNVHFINKLNGQEVANPYTRQMESIWGICMYDDETQPQHTDHCGSARCSDMCVNEGGKATCLCREGYKLTSDSYSCTEDTSKYHRALVLADSHSIYLADVRCLTAAFSTYQHTAIYNTTEIIKFLTVDMIERKVIFATGTEIYSLAIDVASPQAQHIVTSQYGTTGLSLDWIDKNVYWTSGTSSGRVSVVSQNGGNSFTLTTGLNNPRELKILTLEEKMVWISGVTYSSKIEISDLDGTDRETVVPSTQLYSPKSLDFDSHTNRLYWVDSDDIKKVNIDGSGLEVLPVSAYSPNLFLIYKDYLVWTEDSSLESTIASANARNPKQRIYSDSFANVGHVVALNILDETLQPQQKGPCEADNGECEHICIPVGRIGICKCEYGFKIDSNGRTCSSEPLYDDILLVTDWSHNKIYLVSLVDNDDVRAVDIDTAGNPNAVIYDSINKRVVWGDTKDQQIHSAYMNGSDHKVLVYSGVKDSFADRLAIDRTSGNIYYTSASLPQDGSGFKGVSVISPKGDNLDLVSGGYVPRDVVLDPQEGLMFWTDHGEVPSVKRANMDGTSASVIISQNIKWPNGIAIDYQAQKLYLTDGHYNTIQRCTYDGICSIIHTDTGAHLMDIELSGQYLYYTAWNRPAYTLTEPCTLAHITKMNKDDPSDITHLATNAELGRLDSISIYNSSAVAQPVNDDCSSNGGLSDCSTLCLPTSYGRKCTCQNGVSLWPGSNICNDFPKCSSSIPNGQITGACSYLHLSNCSYSCNTFYQPANDNRVISCMNGQWNVKNPCVFSDHKCPATIDKGNFDTSCNYNNGETCRYSCIHGYTPTAAGSSLTCISGSWNSQNPCQEIEPDCPTEVRHVIFSELCLFQNSEQCSYSCETGYYSTSRSIICVGGSWNVDTPCEEIKCHDRVDKVLFDETCTFTIGSTCTYTCLSGYRPTSSSNSMTCANGVWDNASPCEEIRCQSSVPNVKFTTGCPYTHGTTCSYTCQYGYTPTQPGHRLTCNDGSWDNKMPCETIKCPATIAKVSFEGCSFIHGTRCNYTCSAGFVPTSPDETLSCQNGIWDNANPCEQIKCPSTLAKVSFVPGCSFVNGIRCSYTCSAGFVPTSPDDTLSCQNGVWDNANPCEPKVSFEPRCSFVNGTRCSYTCSGGFAPTSPDETLSCQNGVWDNENPCEKTTTSTTTTTTSIPSTIKTTATSTTSTINKSTATSPTSTSRQTEAAIESSTQRHSVVPIAAGAGAGGLVLVAIIVVLICVIMKKSAKTTRRDREPFESPCFQGFDDLATVGGLSAPISVSQRPDSTYDRADRPDTTYDLINFDDLDLKGCSETDEPSRNANVYSSMSKRHGVAPQSGEYESLHRGSPDYLEPIRSNPFEENFM